MSPRSLAINLLLVVALCGCEGAHTEHSDRISDMGIDKLAVNQVIIIPNEGCGGCINAATVYAIMHQEEMTIRKTKVIFTGVKDYKLLKNQIGVDFLTSDLVIIDSMNRFMQKPVISIFPQLITFDSGKLINVVEFDPNADILKLEGGQEN